MSYILIKGVHFGNKGAELMLLAVQQEFAIERSDLKLVLAPGPHSGFDRRMALKTYQFFSFGKGKYDANAVSYLIPKTIRKFFKNRYGIIFESDLSAIVDASGFAYGDNWPLENSRRASNQAIRIGKHGGKYIFLPQAFGPFSRVKEARNMKRALEHSHTAYARDLTSQAYLSSIGVSLPVAEDFTSVVSPEPNGARSGLIVVPNSNMLRGKFEWTRELYISTILKVAETFHSQTGEAVSVMNHEGSSDQIVCEEIVTIISESIGRCELLVAADARSAKTQISEASMVLSSRYHACISALSTGVVCIGTSWSHKYEELYKVFNAENLLVNAVSANSIDSIVGNCLSDRVNIEVELKIKAELEISRSQKLLRDCANFI